MGKESCLQLLHLKLTDVSPTSPNTTSRGSGFLEVVVDDRKSGVTTTTTTWLYRGEWQKLSRSMKADIGRLRVCFHHGKQANLEETPKIPLE